MSNLNGHSLSYRRANVSHIAIISQVHIDLSAFGVQTIKLLYWLVCYMILIEKEPNLFD